MSSPYSAAVFGRALVMELADEEFARELLLGREFGRSLHVDRLILDPVQHLHGVAYLVLPPEIGRALGHGLHHGEALVL